MASENSEQPWRLHLVYIHTNVRASQYFVMNPQMDSIAQLSSRAVKVSPRATSRAVCMSIHLCVCVCVCRVCVILTQLSEAVSNAK